MSVEITVRGEHEVLLPPERGTVHAAITLQHESGSQVHAALAASAERVHDSLRGLHSPDAGPVTWWSAGQLRTWARRPFHDKGKQVPVVHHGQVDVAAKFSDFAVLAHWIGDQAPVPGFTVHRIAWTLTARRRAELVTEVRRGAVHEARRKAQDYAGALDLGEVRLVAVADAGMLGQGLSPEHPGQVAFARGAAAAGSGEEVPLVPADVEVTARVDARFTVG